MSISRVTARRAFSHPLALGLVAAIALFGRAEASMPATAGEEGKIAITTSSEKARASYLEARSLLERLRIQEARPLFAKAVALDPSFALAWLGLANSQNTPKEFFEKLGKAVALADKVSSGERMMILAAQAGADGDNAKQTKLYQKLVQYFPRDERALVLLGNAHFGAQRYAEAISAYESAVRIDPKFSQPYNQLGYSYRFLGRMEDAEKAFTRYTEVLPDDPNPFDSLAELQLKLGRFQEAIGNYRKALAVRPDFFNSNLGIATCLDLQGKGAAARAELDAMYDRATDDGQRRAALFGKTVSWAYEGNFAAAQEEVKKQLAIAERNQDVLGMAGDHATMGNLALATGDFASAQAHFDQGLALVTASPTVADANKENQRRFATYNRAKVALARGDLAAAKKESQSLREAVATGGNPFQKRLAHEIAGRIALAEKRWDEAIAELRQANQLDPYNRYRLAQAYSGRAVPGDRDRAKELARGARNDNTLANLNLALLRQEKNAG